MTHKFKVGDKIYRNKDAVADSSWVRFLSLSKHGGGFIVTKVSPHGGYIQINGWSDPENDYDSTPFGVEAFTLCKDQTDCQACRFPAIGHEHTCSDYFGTTNIKPVDVVRQPNHYQLFPGVEAIQIIARSMTEEMFKGYCLGNALKYRLRAGKKLNAEEDLKKADFYSELFEKHRHACMDEDI